MSSRGSGTRTTTRSGTRAGTGRSTSSGAGRGRAATATARTGSSRGGSTRARTPRTARTPARRPPRRLLRVPVRVWAVLAVLLAAGLVAAAYLTPVLAVRTVDVRGVSAVDDGAVRSALAVGPDTPLLQVDLGAAALRVSRIPRVASVEVVRELPSTLRVEVTERRATLAVAEADGTHLLDERGVDFAVGEPPPGVPLLTTPSPDPADPATVAALTVVEALRTPLVEQVTEVRAPAADAVSVVLGDGRTVLFGSAEDAARKGVVAAAVLSRPGDTVDVTSPDLPTTR